MLRRTGMRVAFRLAEKRRRKFLFLPYRCAVDALASSYVRVLLVFVLTLSGFRKIVGTQRQKNDAHPLGENA